MWILLFGLAMLIHACTSRVCVLNKCRNGASTGEGVTCELLERLLDDSIVEDEVEIDTDVLKLAYVPSNPIVVTTFYKALEKALEKTKQSPRILLILPSSGNSEGVSVGCSNLDDDRVLKSYFFNIGLATGLSPRRCDEGRVCTSSSDFDLHLGFIQRLGLRFSPVSIERQNENVSVSTGKIISKILRLLDDVIVIVVGPTERIDTSKHLANHTNDSATCGDEKDIRPIREMLNEISSIQRHNTHADLIHCKYVTFYTTSKEEKHTFRQKNRAIIPNIENILGPL